MHELENPAPKNVFTDGRILCQFGTLVLFCFIISRSGLCIDDVLFVCQHLPQYQANYLSCIHFKLNTHCIITHLDKTFYMRYGENDHYCQPI